MAESSDRAAAVARLGLQLEADYRGISIGFESCGRGVTGGALEQPVSAAPHHVLDPNVRPAQGFFPSPSPAT
jgi:hypothetical protein